MSRSQHLRSILAGLLALIIAAAAFVPASAQDGAFSSPAQQILNDVNAARVNSGLPPLNVSPQLTEAAQRHVEDVVANGNWGHYGSDGSNIQMRAARVGYPTSSVSENWVAVSDPSQAIGWWMNDWIHRVNILEPRWDEIGVGAAQAGNGYWILVTDFGNIDGGAMPPIAESAPVTQLTAADNISFESLPDNGEYAIQGGDTLLGIAIRFGLDWQDIALANDMGENDLLQIGRVIRLPMPNGGARAESTGGTGGVVAGKKTHSVRTGETLWTISARYQVPWQDIAAVNSLGEYDLLQIGQELKLPASLDDPEPTAEEAQDSAAATGGDAAPAADAAADAAAPEQPIATNASADPADEGSRFVQKIAGPTTYTVQSGDTLLAIAINQDVSWEELAKVNGLDEDSFLQIGQELKLPSAPGSVAVEVAASPAPVANVAASSAGAAPHTYTVESGDTVYGIALEYNVNWEELLRINNLDEDSLLQLGQELKLP